jgi:hypothetical protein
METDKELALHLVDRLEEYYLRKTLLETILDSAKRLRMASDVWRGFPPRRSERNRSSNVPSSSRTYSWCAGLDNSVAGTARHNSAVKRASPLGGTVDKSDRDILRQDTIRFIQLAVPDLFSLSPADLQGQSIERVPTMPWQIAMYLAKQMTDSSLDEIGRQFGGRHHTTVMHSIAVIEEKRTSDPALNSVLNKLLKQLQVSSAG